MRSETKIAAPLTPRKLSKEGTVSGLLIRLLGVRFTLRPRALSAAHMLARAGERSETRSVFGLPARDWLDVGRALAVGCLLGLLVALSGCGAVTLPWEIGAAILTGSLCLFCAAAALGIRHGERRALRALEEESKAIPSLWKGARR